MSSRRLSDLRLADASSVVKTPGQKALTPFSGEKDVSNYSSSISGRRVLVTGAGGSIGSELVAQIAMLNPAHLVLVEACEYNLYQVGQTIERLRPAFNWTANICDIRDEDAVRNLFVREKPEIVFHAAALKHVPLLEDQNVIEAARTNVLGTKIVLDLCCAFGADFVMISTDKAVNPSSCMGLTKRVAEVYVHDRAKRFSGIRTSLVRFGNVLGSSGSVAPLFQKQIEAGGPVTVTHPKMTRYLMTIDQAVRLTLAASSLPQQGFSLYVLDMGRPVRIVDMAMEMIKRAGLRPFLDIDIQFVGIRPGEKLHEELNYEWEDLLPTPIAGVRAAKPRFDPEPKLHLIDALLAAATARDAKSVKHALVEIVPEYVGAKRRVERQRKTKIWKPAAQPHPQTQPLEIVPPHAPTHLKTPAAPPIEQLPEQLPLPRKIRLAGADRR
jgi:O-antigen biosynthesis protein WbqV